MNDKPAFNMKPESWLVSGVPWVSAWRSPERAAYPSFKLHHWQREYSRDDGTPTWEALEEVLGLSLANQ